MPDSTTAPAIVETRWTAQPTVDAGVWLVVESGATPGGIPYCNRVVAECRGEGAERNARIMAGATEMQKATRRGFDLICMLLFEPDRGKPHPLKDGIADQVLARMRTALANAELED